MVAKRIVPWFGGTPAVWTLCLAFYQSALFLGYAYAHALIRWASPTQQVFIHAVLLVGAAASLPVLPRGSWAASEFDSPTRRILELLSVEVALPFAALAATGPLVQRWFADRFPSRSPYPLYALSNLGSLVALLAYPFWIEPRWPLSSTGTVWGIGFIGVASAIMVCSVLARSARAGATSDETPEADASLDRTDAPLWVMLAGSAVVLLMGVSNRLCLDVASIPFLWVTPLAIYLSTFIIGFAGDRWYSRRVFSGISVAVLAIGLTRPVAAAAGVALHPFLNSIYFEVLYHCSLLFAACMVLHGELYRRRPAPRHLTRFYLCVSGGGALGGLFVGVVAPRIFDGYAEMAIGLLLGVAGVGWIAWRERNADSDSARFALHPAWILLAAMLVAPQLWLSLRDDENLIWRERTFFGVHRVLESGSGSDRHRRLLHGSTLHGTQFFANPQRQNPTSYFGRATGLSALMSTRDSRPARIGVVGLGAGTIAAYGRPQDFMRFYEIDPAVARIATDLFGYLSESKATVDVVLGDARLVLDEERAKGERHEYDILIIDAFSSDSIPTHLITAEAFDGYRSALAKRGVLAVHTTNRHLQLIPIVSRLGASLGMRSLRIETQAVAQFQSQAAEWVFLSSQPDALQRIARAMANLHDRMGLGSTSFRATVPDPEALADVPLWTDDYTDLFGALRPL